MGEFVLQQWLKKTVDTLIEEAGEEVIILSPNDEVEPSLALTLLQKAAKKHLKVTLVYSSYNTRQHFFAQSANPVYEQFPDLEIRVDSMLKTCYFANEKHALALIPHTGKKFTSASGGWLLQRSETDPLLHAGNCNRHLQQVLFNSRLVFKRFPLR